MAIKKRLKSVQNVAQNRLYFPLETRQYAKIHLTDKLIKKLWGILNEIIQLLLKLKWSWN